MCRQTEKEIRALFAEPHAKEYFAQDETISAQAKFVMKALRARTSQIFNIAAKPIAEKMTHAESKSSALSLKTSLEALSEGLSLKTDFITGDLKEVLAATITENVGLIKSIPEQYFTQIEGAVMRSITTGNGLQDLVPFIKKYEGITLRRARIIARDQTRKAFSNLNFARMDKDGVKQYEWLHSSGGQKPRKLHQRMSGKVYRIDNPPVIDDKTGQRGKPGDLINCRCRAIPIVSFAEA
jgi:SPP1 gp7 family putative phage head morphogenesis protein